MKDYFLECAIGLLCALTIIGVALASAIEIPFIYQGF